MLDFCVSLLVLAAAASPSATPLLRNGGFEETVPAPAAGDGLLQGWKLGAPALLPAFWTLNPAYPGELEVVSSVENPARSPGGHRYVRITAQKSHAHLYQMCSGLSQDKWYRVSARVRGGPVSLSFYEYFSSGKIGGQSVIPAAGNSPDWKRIEGFYRPTAGGYLRSALAVAAAPGGAVEVDEVSIEELALPEVPTGQGIVLETEAARISLSSEGMLQELRAKGSGQDYAVAGSPWPLLEAKVNGQAVPLHSLVREGDLIRARFLEPSVQVALRVAGRKRHLRWEVAEVQPPGGLEELTVRFPVQRLGTSASALNATYDEEFGVALLGLTEGAHQLASPLGSGGINLTISCSGRRGIVGAAFALTAAPRSQFENALMETERENGLPCPMLEGRWARVSEPVRRSYLFVVDAEESKVDRIIEYAKLGRFGAVVFLKDNWLETHGHYRINTKRFPRGLASLREAVAKIHAAGLDAGVHVFGPSISPNDPYVTPKPDDRLAGIDCPPLAQAVDAKATVLPVAGEPPLPPKGAQNTAFPGNYLRIGDEIVRYRSLELAPEPRFTGCERGVHGSEAAPHEKGAAVKGLLAMWNYFLVDPDSTLANELTTNFAEVCNACDFDMVYFDASDGIIDTYLNRGYYLDKLHLGFYRKLKKDVLYQTSNGTGSNLVWHIVPRSASADGHGDLKNYLDERLPAMRGMAANLTRPDVGWYYMFDEVRPDQIEYVCGKTMGLDGSISIETSLATMDQHPRARQMIEMVGRYEMCRMARAVSGGVRAKLGEPGKDFKLFGAPGSWQLYRAAYEEPRYVETLDGAQNAWTIHNDLPMPCLLGVEIARGRRDVPTSDYEQPGAVAVEGFDDAKLFRWESEAQARKLFPGGEVSHTAEGAVKPGVALTLETSPRGKRAGRACAVLSAVNRGPRGGWCAVARKLQRPVDLSRCEGLALWVDGDGKGETLRLQLQDASGHQAVFAVPVSFSGWRLCVFRTNSAKGFDWSKTGHLLVWMQGLAGNMSVRVRLDELRGLPALHPAAGQVQPSLQVNGQLVAFPASLGSGQALTAEGPGGIQLWPGGMQPGQPLTVPAAPLLALQPGENRVLFSAGATGGGYPGDIQVLLYRMWPLEDP